MGTLLLVFAMLLQAPAATAPPPAQPPVPAAQAPAPPAAPQPPPPDPYSYSPDGRRDPFLSLLGASSERGGAPARRGDGIAGIAVAEMSVRGVLQSRGDLIAMVQGPDNRTYLVRSGDKFADGMVQSVTAEGLVIVQEVNDPLSLVKQRVVRKPLRALEDVKQ
jgi:type IV pilus assembly protein PilP